MQLTPALEMEDISKEFVGVKALTEASLTCLPGEVHALVGENGAGKSTLIKVAAGALHPDTGTVRIGGELLHPASTLKARRLGLLTAYQDTSLVPGLSVAENVLLSFHGTRKLGGRLQYEEAARLLEPYDLPFSVEDRVAGLSPGSRQLLEIVRVMAHDPKVLLLDEPTAALDAANIARLEALIETVRARGTAILYISHRLDEVRRIAQRLTVIRDGRIQGSYDGGEWDVEEIVALMVGERTDLAFPPKPGVPADAPPAIAARGLRGDGFGPVDLLARRGEIVGVAGAEGNGQRELLRTLVGLRRGRGTVEIDGAPVKLNTPRAALAHGITFQSGDRAAESVFAELSVMENSTLSIRDELGPVGLVMRSRQRRRFDPLADRLGIVRASDHQPIGELSGGNQQKTVLSRALARETPILICEEPTAGVDARARLDIYRALRGQADEGTAIVLSSSDASELEGMCDRVYVLSRGRVVSELTADSVEESQIVSAFVDTAGGGEDERAEEAAAAAEMGTARRWARAAIGSSWTPLAVLAFLILALGAYTTARSDVFLTDSNLNSLLILALPLAVVALGQQALLIAGGFDMSVGSTMSLTVVIASFAITADSLAASIPGILLCLVVGVGVGLLNGTIVRVLGVSPIITTIATLGILQGIALLLRPEPGGPIGLGLSEAVSEKIGFMPVAFLVVIVAALVAELALRGSNPGLTARATGLSEEAARRTGIRIETVKFGAYVLCAVVAVIAGLMLAAQVGIGQATVGVGYPLTAFTACFLGGAVLTGGRGSFVGALLGAIFLSLLVNITPLLSLPDATSRVVTGVLTIVAVLVYSLSERASTQLRKAGDAPAAPPPSPTPTPATAGGAG